jgi:hypothetical protein
MCPDNNESAGKNHSGRTTSGYPWLAGQLTECRWAARYTKDTYLASQFWQIARRRSFHRRHTILVIAWHIISTPRLTYEELGGDFFARRLIDQLEALGLKVSIQPAAV